MGTIIALPITVIAVCVAGVSWHIGTKVALVQYVSTLVAFAAIVYLFEPLAFWPFVVLELIVAISMWIAVSVYKSRRDRRKHPERYEFEDGSDYM